MNAIVEGMERWNVIRSHAEALRAEGKLDYVTLKQRASCGGDVAQRIMKALKAEGLTGVEADAGEKAADTPGVGKLPQPYQARWDASTAQLHRISIEALDALATEHVARLTAEASRHNEEIRELRANLEAALEDVDGYSTQASDAQDKLVANEAAMAELTASLASIRERCAYAEAGLATTAALLRSTEAQAQADRTAAATASVRAEIDVDHWRRRAEAAEASLAACRTDLAAENTRAARLEGERDAVVRAQQDLRALLEMHAMKPVSKGAGDAAAGDLADE